MGITKNLKSRYIIHQKGGVPHTRKFRPVVVVWYAGFCNIELARSFETYLKSSSGKSFRNKHLITTS